MSKVFFVVVACVAFLCSCSHSEATQPKNLVEPNLEELTVNADLAASRATSTAFEEGDQIGLYAVIVGQEMKAAGNHTDNAQFTATADGVIAADPGLYYPDAKSAIMLYAYYPYNSSVVDATKMPFTVTDDLKASDLCYAQREALPSKEAQTLQFKHSLSRVVVNVNFDGEPKVKSVTAVKFINTATDFTVDLNTGAITLGEQSETLATNQLSANQYEAIVAPQTFAARQAMLKIEVLDQSDAPQSYYYAPFEALTLTEAALNTLNIVLNDHNIATMKGAPQIADWTATTKSDIARKDVSNRFTAHWLIAEPQFASVNKIMLTVKDSLRNSTTKLTADNVKLVAGSSLAAASYTFDFAPSGLDYPYTIQSVEFYNGMTLISSVIPNISTVAYKTGAMTFGVDQKAVLTLSAYSASVAAQTNSASFNLTSNVPYSSAYSAGSSSAQGSGGAPPYNNAGVTFNFPAQGAVAVAAKTHTMTITPAVDYLVGSQRRTFTVTQAAVPCTFALSPTTASVGAQVTQASFTLSSNAPYTSTYNTYGSWSTEGVGNTPPYTNRGIYFNFPAQGAVASVAKTYTMTVSQSTAAALAPKSGTLTVTQAAVPCTFALSATTASVGAQVTSAAFTLSSNAPYTSTYTTGGSSSQGVGSTPPYSNTAVTLNFPAQGSFPAAIRTHTMTVMQTAAASLNPKSGTYIVTQEGVPPTLELSANTPGVTIPKDGATYWINVYSNDWWGPLSTNTVPVDFLGHPGDYLNLPIVVPASPMGTRIVSVTFFTHGNAGHPPVSRTWSGTQEARVTPSGCFPTAVPSFPYLFVALANNATSNWQTANNNCAAWGGRLPTRPELLAIYNNKASYGTFARAHWSSSMYNNITTKYDVVNMESGGVYYGVNDDQRYDVRCVKDTWGDYHTTSLPGYQCTYVALADNAEVNGDTATANCAVRDGRLPTMDELVAIYNNKARYGSFVDDYYWSSTRSNEGLRYIVNISNGKVSTTRPNSLTFPVRCVK